jgi:hypothetical protein
MAGDLGHLRLSLVRQTPEPGHATLPAGSAVNEGTGLGDWLIALAGTADCPEISSFRDWLRRLPAESLHAVHRRRALASVSQS